MSRVGVCIVLLTIQSAIISVGAQDNFKWARDAVNAFRPWWNNHGHGHHRPETTQPASAIREEKLSLPTQPVSELSLRDQQCPCVKPPGASQCIAYNPRHQAATLDEALAFFKDTIADPERAEPVSKEMAESLTKGTTCGMRCQACKKLFVDHFGHEVDELIADEREKNETKALFRSLGREMGTHRITPEMKNHLHSICKRVFRWTAKRPTKANVPLSENQIQNIAVALRRPQPSTSSLNEQQRRQLRRQNVNEQQQDYHSQGGTGSTHDWWKSWVNRFAHRSSEDREESTDRGGRRNNRQRAEQWRERARVAGHNGNRRQERAGQLPKGDEFQENTQRRAKRQNYYSFSSKAGTSLPVDCRYTRGEELDDGSQYTGLCNLCWSFKSLPEGYFPRFINELQCDSADDGCLAGWGKCRPRWRSVEVLYNYGTTASPNWQQQSMSAVVACECQVRSGSPLHAFISRK